MLDVLHHLALGFVHVFSPFTFLALVVGLVLGLLVAVLPGLTLVMGVVLALPFTYGLGITPAIVLLTAMYVSGTYGGAFTAILFRIPGEPIDVPLLWDGYKMAHRGEAAKALGFTLFAALIGGLLSAMVMVLLAQPVARLALVPVGARVLRDHLLRADQRRLPRRRLAGQCVHLAAARPVHLHGRRRRHLRRRPLLVRHADPVRRHRVHHRDGRRLRPRRGPGAARAGFHQRRTSSSLGGIKTRLPSLRELLRGQDDASCAAR